MPAARRDDQMDFMKWLKPKKSDIRKLKKLESKIDHVIDAVRDGFKDGECVTAARVDPGRVDTMVEKLKLLRKHLLIMERDLRSARAKGTVGRRATTKKRVQT